MATEQTPALRWNRSTGTTCTSKCGRATLRRVGADYRRDWAVSVDGTHRGAYHGLATAKTLAASYAA